MMKGGVEAEKERDGFGGKVALQLHGKQRPMMLVGPVLATKGGDGVAREGPAPAGGP